MAGWFLLALAGCPARPGPSPSPSPIAPEPTADTGTPTEPTGSTGDTGTPPPLPEDVAVQLAAIDGMTVEELTATGYPYRAFALTFEQPVDHADPAGATFEQHLTLVHYDAALPMTLVSTGGADFIRDAHQEPTVVLGANQVVVEKRFHGASRPDPTDWTRMTVAQIAADTHRVRETLGAVYGGPWIATGTSLGGADALYYRYLHPDDVVGTVAYGASFPIEYGDPRFPAWFSAVAPTDCQQALEAVQIALLDDERDEVLALLAEDPQTPPTDRIGLDAAYVATVLGLPWSFWQSFGEPYCGDVPAVLNAGTVLGFYQTYGFGLYYGSDTALDLNDPYYWQVQTELGPPEIPDDALEGLVPADRIDLAEGVLPVDAPEAVFTALNPEVVEWLETAADQVILVYGELDPWSAGGVFPAVNPGVRVYTVPGANHGATLGLLPEDERLEAWGIVEGWSAP